MAFKHQWGEMSVVDKKETRPTKCRVLLGEASLTAGGLISFNWFDILR